MLILGMFSALGHLDLTRLVQDLFARGHQDYVGPLFFGQLLLDPYFLEAPTEFLSAPFWDRSYSELRTHLWILPSGSDQADLSWTPGSQQLGRGPSVTSSTPEPRMVCLCFSSKPPSFSYFGRALGKPQLMGQSLTCWGQGVWLHRMIGVCLMS